MRKKEKNRGFFPLDFITQKNNMKKMKSLLTNLSFAFFLIMYYLAEQCDEIEKKKKKKIKPIV
jgi:hypothetical protein